MDTHDQSFLLPGYSVAEVFWRTPEFTLVHAQDTQTGAFQALKVSVVDPLVDPEKAQLYYECEQIRTTSSTPTELRPRVIRVGAVLGLALDAKVVSTLSTWLRSTCPDPTTVAAVFAKIANILAESHKRGIAHGALRCDNVLLLGSEVCPVLLGYVRPGAATSLLEQGPGPTQAPHAHGDLFALGVCLYQALTEVQPFSGDSAIELRHAIETTRPCPPHTIARVPVYLSQLAIKLLSRNPSERYQTASAACADLSRFVGTGDAELLLDDRADLLGRIRRNRQIYGRERELDWLQQRLQHSRTSMQLVLLSGPAGAGKSTLVDALFTDAASMPGVEVARGKFDQLHKGLASSAVTQVLAGLVRRMLGQESSVVSRWRERLIAALGPSAAVLPLLVPELEDLFSDLPPPQTLGPTQHRTRLMRGIMQLVASCSNPNTSMILFVDDVQWSDSFSLDVLANFADTNELDNALIIIALRTDELPENHPTLERLAHLATSDRCQSLALAALEHNAIARSVADVLDDQTDVVEPVARLLFEKTGGNPLFAHRLMQELAEQEALRLDPSSQRWVLNMEFLQAAAVSANLVHFMRARLEALASNDKIILHRAACLGREFSWNELKALSPVSLPMTISALQRAIDRQLVTLIDGAVGADSGSAGKVLASGQDTTLRFHHDRIQRAAYEALPPEVTAECHEHIGHTLVRILTPQQVEARIFEIVGHLGRADMTKLPPALRRERVMLNVRAADKAHRATEYTESRSYLVQARACLEPRAWDQDYAICRRVYLGCATAAYLTGNPDEAERCLEVVASKSRTILEQAEVHVIALTQLTVWGRYDEALSHGTDALELLGYELGEQGTAQATMVIDVAVQTGKAIALPTQPAMRDPNARLAMEILGSMLPLTFISQPTLFPAVASLALSLSLQQGPAPQSAISFAAYGILLTTQDRYQDASNLGEVAMAIAERFGDLSQICKAGEIVLACICHWKAPLTECSNIAERALEAGMQNGDVQYCGYVLLYDLVNRFAAGERLGSLVARLDDSLEYCRRTNNQISCDVLDGCAALIERHIGAHTDDAAAWEREYLRRCRANGSHLAEQIYHALATQYAFIHGDLSGGCTHAAQAAAHNQSAPGVVTLAVLDFYTALLGAAQHRAGSEDQELQARARASAERIASWADNAPDNFAHKRDLIVAEAARNTGHTALAMRKYDEAIRGAKHAGFIQEQALASELAADFYMASEVLTVAQGLMRSAIQLWRTWGDVVRADDLTRKYERSYLTTPDDSISERSASAPDIPTEALFRAARAMSEELDVECLLRQLVHTTMLFSGFGRTVLLINDQGQLVPRTECKSRNPPRTIAAGDQSLEHSLPMTMLRLVAKTGSIATHDKAHPHSDFASDPYFRSSEPAAAIAMAWRHKGQTIAVVYLENRVTLHLPDPQRLRQLEVLGAQGAVSITNARLVESLRVEIEQRSKVEARLALSLKDQEVLLRELAHRVKNNLQVMHSVLWLGMGRSTDPQTMAILETSRQRIQTMARVHEYLSPHNASDISSIQSYIRRLVADTVSACRLAHTPTSVEVRVAPIDFDLNFNFLGPFGLILHELISNCCKHNQDRALSIRVALFHEDEHVTLLVADDGRGQPQPFADESQRSAGLRIVYALAKQIDGEIHVSRDDGLIVELRVPVGTLAA